MSGLYSRKQPLTNQGVGKAACGQKADPAGELTAIGRGAIAILAPDHLLQAGRPVHFRLGQRLLNQNIRNSVSYTKDEVLMPGLGVRAFANLKF